MSKLNELITQMKTVDYREKQQFLEYLLRIAERNPKVFSSDDSAALLAFAYEEVEVTVNALHVVEYTLAAFVSIKSCL